MSACEKAQLAAAMAKPHMKKKDKAGFTNNLGLAIVLLRSSTL
jgi:hypothetical protein